MLVALAERLRTAWRPSTSYYDVVFWALCGSSSPCFLRFNATRTADLFLRPFSFLPRSYFDLVTFLARRR